MWQIAASEALKKLEYTKKKVKPEKLKLLHDKIRNTSDIKINVFIVTNKKYDKLWKQL